MQKLLFQISKTLFAIFALAFLLTLNKTHVNAESNPCGSDYWVAFVSKSNAVSIQSDSCYSSYSEAQVAMYNAESTVEQVASIYYKDTLVDTAYGILNLNTTGSSAYNSYINSVEGGRDYFNGYYTAEGPLITTTTYNPSSATTQKAKTIVAGLTGNIEKKNGSLTQWEIIPYTKATIRNYYTVNSKNEIVHHFGYGKSSQRDLVIGPAPSYLITEEYKVGTKFYSYDGHYFYIDFFTMIKDYRADNRAHAVNVNEPYYNYYQYLPFRSKTNYSAAEIDSYLSGTRGYTNKAWEYISGTDYPRSYESNLYDTGGYFMQLQQNYGVNPMLALAVAANESAWGRSYYAITRYNMFGYGAFDSNPDSANYYQSVLDSILSFGSRLTANYLNANVTSSFYNGGMVGDKEAGVNVKWASDAYWGEKAAAYYYQMDKAMGMKDYGYYTIGVTKQPNAWIYKTIGGSKAYNLNGIVRKNKDNSVLIVGEEKQGDVLYYKIIMQDALSASKTFVSDGMTAKWNWETNVHYIKQSDILVVNKGSGQNPQNSAEDNKVRFVYLDVPVPVKIVNNAETYSNGYLSRKEKIILAKDTTSIVIAKAYNAVGDTAYLVTYSAEQGKSKWVDANDCYELPGVYTALKMQEKDTDSAQATNTVGGSTVAKIRFNNTPMAIINKEANGKYYQVAINAEKQTVGWVNANNLTNIKKYEGGLLDKTEPEVTPDPGTPEIPEPEVPETPDTPEPPIVPEEPNTPNPDLPLIDSEWKQEKGEFNLEGLELSADSKSVTIFGNYYFNNQDTSKDDDIYFALRLINEQTKKETLIPLSRWLNEKEWPYDLSNAPSIKTNTNGAWFKSSIDFTDIASGNYDAYVLIYKTNNKTYSETLLSNMYSRKIASRFINKDGAGIEFRTDFTLRSLPLEIMIRKDGLLSQTPKATLDNAFVEYTNIEFKENALNIKGTAFSIGGQYKTAENIKRQIVLENISTLERKIFDIGATTKGEYDVILRVDDKKSKAAAWYDANLEINELNPGIYAILVHTVSENGVDDYGELVDYFGRTLNVSHKINGKQYKIFKDVSNRNRVLLEVKTLN